MTERVSERVREVRETESSERGVSKRAITDERTGNKSISVHPTTHLPLFLVLKAFKLINIHVTISQDMPPPF